MAQANITWSHNLKGGPPTMKTFTTSEAVAAGDIVVHDSAASTISRMDAVDESVLGVAVEDSASGAECQIIIATAEDVFEFTTVGTGFTTGTHDYTKVDVADFTTGGMEITAGSGDGDVLMLTLVDGETSGSAGNRVLGIFQTRVF